MPSRLMAEKKDRYVPSLKTVKAAAESLPEAMHFRGDVYHVPVKGERLIEFKKVRFKTREGRHDRWIYEGKLIVP